LAETFSNMQSVVLENLDRISPATAETTQAGRWINQCIREDICNLVNFPWMEAIENKTTVKDQSIYTWTDQTKFKDVQYIYFRKAATDEWRRLDEIQPVALHDHYITTENSEPVVWARVYSSGNHGFDLRGVPSTAGWLIRAYLWNYPAELTGSNTNEILDTYPGLVEAGACARGALHYKNLDAASMWTLRFQAQKLAMLRAERGRRDQSRPVLRMSAASGRPSSGRRRGSRNHGGSAYDWLP